MSDKEIADSLKEAMEAEEVEANQPVPRGPDSIIIKSNREALIYNYENISELVVIPKDQTHE